MGFVQLYWLDILWPDPALLPAGFWPQDPLRPGCLLTRWSPGTVWSRILPSSCLCAGGLGEAWGAVLGHKCCCAGLCLQERFVVHITDVLAVSMMLGITAQVKEAGIAWDKGEKKSKNPE